MNTPSVEISTNMTLENLHLPNSLKGYTPGLLSWIYQEGETFDTVQRLPIDIR